MANETRDVETAVREERLACVQWLREHAVGYRDPADDGLRKVLAKKATQIEKGEHRVSGAAKKDNRPDDGEDKKDDPVNHPRHYTSDASGVECIDVVEHRTFNIGNALKYLWRAGRKGDLIEDLQKAQWYVAREIQRLTKGSTAAKAEPTREEDHSAPPESALPDFLTTAKMIIDGERGFCNAAEIARSLEIAWRGGFATGAKAQRTQRAKDAEPVPQDSNERPRSGKARGASLDRTEPEPE